MCGIAGFIDFNKRLNKKLLVDMTDVLYHRGPDDSGYQFIPSSTTHIGLGHRRLSILDLSKHGHQPMQFQDISLVYNGEIYNFQEIRQELQEHNYTFTSHSDTEVILKAYHKWGLQAIHKFNGMFSIAIYDKQNEKFFLIRDRAGVKPLYYYKKDNTLLYSSELKSFHQYPSMDKKLNTDALQLFLQYQYIPEPHSIFTNVHKVRAGHYLEINLKTKALREQKYWDVIEHYNKPKLDISESEAVEETEKLLTDAFAYRMVSDVPVGIFLSGGYDSSIVTALLQKNSTDRLKTYTIGFHEKGFDEAPYAAKVAEYLGCDHTEYYCTQQDAVEIIPKLAEIYDEPFSDSSAIPTVLVSQLARKDVTVSLSADGGDEIFAGYDTYTRTLQYFNFFKKFPLSARKPLAGLMDLVNPDYIPLFSKTYNHKTRYEKVKEILRSAHCVEAMNLTGMYFTASEASELLHQNSIAISTNFDNYPLLNSYNDDINQMLAIDYTTYMRDDILTKIDRATMSVSLEGREPLLDYRIIEFVAQLPSHFKYKNGNKKYLLKEIAHRHLPKELMDRPKMGFGVPIFEWFRDELKTYFTIYLERTRLEKEGIFNVDKVLQLKKSYMEGKAENIEKLWSILMFEMWYERWM
jgi:asparagine synthase (glutamine-hydrolysing)